MGVVLGGCAAVEKAAKALDDEIVVVEQAEQNGTAHAVAQARGALDGFQGNIRRALYASASQKIAEVFKVFGGEVLDCS